MNRTDLQDRLMSEGIRKDTFSIYGDYADEAYILSKESAGKWSVYYSERGLRTAEKLFDSEEGACQHFYDLLAKDPTVRSK